MKVIKNIIRFILLIVLIAVGILIYKGYTIYKQALENTSITDKVAEIHSKENYTKLEDMSDFYLDAVIAVEDIRFYKHGSTDPVAIGRAILVNIKSMKLKEGGSTITQQLAKNIYLTQEKSALRKIAEIFMAYEIERNCNKDTVLELYLNTSYFGNGYYNIKEASLGYFGKLPSELNDYEATMLAGVPNAPSVYAPTVNFKLASERQVQVLNKMVKYNYITEEERKEILSQTDYYEDYFNKK